MKKYLKVSILVDNPKSWFHKYLDIIFGIVRKYDPKYLFVTHASSLKKGDILFILSCDHILNKSQLSLHKNNIVIHASDLPKGRGWSPMTWQVESGKSDIPVTLFEASQECDSGDYYIKDHLKIDDTDLVDDMRRKLAHKIAELISKYLASYPMKGTPQKGKPTYCRKRRPEDNELDINRSLKSQFDKMRVADNEQYPLCFKLKGQKYVLRIEKG